MQATLAAWLSLAALAGGQGSIDLSEVVAKPLDAEFTESGGAGFLTGAFDAHRYAVWLATTGSQVTPIEDTLNAEGFVRGYARSWSRPIHQEVGVGESRLQYLSETVEEFQSDVGATQRLNGTQAYTLNMSGYQNKIEPSIANAYGAVVDLGYSIEYTVAFRKGNDAYYVEMESGVNNLTDQVTAQARSQYDVAPAYSIPPDKWRAPEQPAGVANVQDDRYILARSLFSPVVGVPVFILVGVVLVWLRRVRRPSAQGPHVPVIEEAGPRP